MKKLLFGTALVGALAMPGLASAQTVVGPTVLYHDNADFGVGAFVMFPLEQFDPNLGMNVNFGYYFPDAPTGVDVNFWELNADVLYHFPVAADAPVSPFALGGLNIARASGGAGGFTESNTEIGINLGGGITFPSDSFRPLVGAKIELEGGDGFVLFAGLGFPVGN